MSRGIVQIQSISTSLNQILCGLINQMLISNTVKVFFSSTESYPGLMQFRLKGNNKSKSVSKIVFQCRFKPVIPRNMYKK